MANRQVSSNCWEENTCVALTPNCTLVKGGCDNLNVSSECVPRGGRPCNGPALPSCSSSSSIL